MANSEVPINSSSIDEDYNDPPQVSLPLLRGKDMPRQSEPLMDIELPVDILLLTVEDCEFLSCVSHFNEGFRKSYHQDLGYVYFGRISKDECMKVAVMECFVGSAGPATSCVTVKNAIVVLKPKCVFCVGFCSGLNYPGVKLGDVLISGKYLTETKTRIQQRSIGIPLSSRIATVVKRAADGWRPPLRDPKNRQVKVHTGCVFLSGTEKLNSKRLEELVKRFPETIALVTESEGLFTAAHDLKMEWIVVKGVSNFADNRELNTVAWRNFASVMAASLTFHILGDNIVFKDWPHYEVPSADESKRKKKEPTTGTSRTSSDAS